MSDENPNAEPDDDLPPDLSPPDALHPQDFPQAGTSMDERQSLERVVEGMKVAADGARHLAFHYEDDRFDYVAENLDKIRAWSMELGGNATPSAVRPTEVVRSSPMPPAQALSRLLEGLKQAEGAAFQMATGHRADAAWTKVAGFLRDWQDKARVIARRRNAAMGMTPGGIFLPN